MEENGTKRKLSDNDCEQVVKKTKVSGKESGVLLFSGLSNYAHRGDKSASNEHVKWSPHRFEALEGIRIRDVSKGPMAYFFLAISEEGKVYAWGLNDKGQLGMGDFEMRQNPTLMESMVEHKVVAVATGRQVSLILTDEGDVYSCGDNKCGQCGVKGGKRYSELCVPTKINYDGAPIVKIACGDEFSLILNADGDVFSFGSPEHGQLGHGSEEKEVAHNKVLFNYSYTPTLISAYIEIDDGEIIPHGQPVITHIDVGVNHSCAIDAQQRLFTWGFGGYGRLGHNDTKNELRPRLMKCWYRITGRADGGVTRVFCGAQFNMVQTIVEKCTYMFGQFHRNAEANMYPKFIDDLMGWNVRSLVCNQFGYFVCADDCVIASQPGPSFGTLAMGEKIKSSTSPKVITTLKDVYCLRVGAGYVHSLFIVRDTTDKDKEAIAKFPMMQFSDKESEPDVDEKEQGKKKNKSKPKPKPKKKK